MTRELFEETLRETEKYRDPAVTSAEGYIVREDDSFLRFIHVPIAPTTSPESRLTRPSIRPRPQPRDIFGAGLSQRGGVLHLSY